MGLAGPVHDPRRHEAARKAQTGGKVRERKTGTVASPAGTATDLELARAELRALREERDRLKATVQRGLGQQVGQAGNAELITRINELTAANQELGIKPARAEANRDGLQSGLTEAQDKLISARQALRNMMRDQNRDAT
ncbi:hypothetical protein ACWGBX_04530 [Streptomyces sp. NPDC055037]